MLLKKVSTGSSIFEVDDQDAAFETMLLENCEKFPEGPCNGGGGPAAEESKVESSVSKPKRKRNKDQGGNIRDLMTAFAICNNVTPVPDDPELMASLDKRQVRATAKPQQIEGLFDAAPNSAGGRATFMPNKFVKEEVKIDMSKP